MKYIILSIFILCLMGCSDHPKKTKCVNGYLYQQVNKDSQIYTKVEYLNHYTQCVNQDGEANGIIQMPHWFTELWAQ